MPTQNDWNRKNDEDNMLTRRTSKAANESYSKRFGCFPILIGASLQYTLQKPMIAGNRVHAKGARVYLTVQDITRHREAEGHTHWVCRAPACASKTWPSRAALVADHPASRELAGLVENGGPGEEINAIHAYHAVANIPGVVAVPAKHAENGDVIDPPVLERNPTILLLSDVE